MKIPLRPLLVLHAHARFRDRVRSAVRGDYGFRAVSDWDTLYQALRDSPPAAVVIVDPYFDSGGDEISPGLRSLMADFPSVPVLAALEVGPDDADALVRIGGHGVCDIVSIGHDDTATALRHRLGKAECRPLKLLLADILPADLGGRARAILDTATGVVSGGGDGSDLARSLGVSRRTLLRWSEIAALPPPRRLLAWLRILLAAELLDDPGRSVLGVAQACGYSSDSGLRRVTMKFVGLTPTELRARGAFAGATKRFVQELERYHTRPWRTSRAAFYGAEAGRVSTGAGGGE